MRGALVHHLSAARRHLPNALSHLLTPPPTPSPAAPFPSRLLKLRPLSTSDGESTSPPPPPPSDPENSSISVAGDSSQTTQEAKSSAIVEDVSNEEFKLLIEKYLIGNDVDALPSVMEAILRRRLSGKHEHTDDELVEELRMRPLDDLKDEDIEDDFEDRHDTNEEIENLYDTMPDVEKKIMQDKYFNMDDKKWDDLVRDAMEKGIVKDTSECEQILEDMLSWEKLVPAEIKQKIEAKFNELEDMCKRGEMEPEEACELLKEYEDKMVEECEQLMAEEEKSEEIETDENSKKVRVEDPPGEGPVLRWQTRVVFTPGGDSWHPKNRKVKLSVTVKELGLSKYAARRLRELVGKRYNSGKDELTITSERFEHREENRKDCLRTLYALIEEAMKADELVDNTRTAYVKNRLRANEPFMERLRAKVASRHGSPSASAS